MTDEEKAKVMDMPCKCGKESATYSTCCGNTPCACTSGKMDKDCCMKNAPEATETPAV